MRRLALLPCVLAVGCVHALEARALEPHPLVGPRPVDAAAEAPRSAPLYIYVRDVLLEELYPRAFQLRHSAQLVAVSRDRVRFHVRLVQLWEEMANTRGWQVWLEDEGGRKLAPAAREVPRVDRLAIEWVREQAPPGTPKERLRTFKLIPQLDAYQGKADYVFYERDLLGPRRRQLTLIFRKGDVELRWLWRFGDGLEIRHHGRTPNDDERRVVVVPGPETRVAHTDYEDAGWTAAGDR